MAFGLVAVQQCRIGPAGGDAGQLPGQVVSIGDAAVHAQPAQRGGDVRGVAGQEYSPSAERVGHERGWLPEANATDMHLDGWVAERPLRERGAVVVGEALPRFASRVERQHQQPLPLVVHCSKRCLRSWLPQPVHRRPPVPHPFSKVGLDQDADPIA